jgi:hypothetical protein
MPYTLTNFCSDLSASLKAKGTSALPDIAAKLSALLANPAFVAATFNDDTSRKAPRSASRTATAPRGRSTAPRAASPR